MISPKATTVIFLVAAFNGMNKVMIGQGFAPSPTDASPSTLAEALDRLKSRGCLVLVVGPVGDDAKYAGCRRLLGDELSMTRRRLFVTTDSDVTKHPGAKATCTHRSLADSRAINYRTPARSTTAQEAMDALKIEETVVEGDLQRLSSEIAAALQKLDSRADGLEPGELRVCIDDLGSIIANDDTVEVVEFVSELRQLVLSTGGMCHAHIPRNIPGSPVDAILRYFDAILEVESRDECRQRWHIQDAGITTGWLEL